ncbi:hypothetical protein [Mycobacteroides abscessus]|uniref:hypothetical protein n=1 Tax=Mycobacteroides abscessus TaxID=36809 RepID=UPI000C25815E|nr:hypothetical protein [Mycobacteroides abscessus]
MDRQQARLEAVQRYVRHCRRLGYVAPELTLLMIGFQAGWDQSTADGLERIVHAIASGDAGQSAGDPRNEEGFLGPGL